MNYKNKYTDCSGKEFFTNAKPTNKRDLTTFHVTAVDEYGVKYLLKFSSILEDNGNITYDRVPVYAKCISQLDVMVKEGIDDYLVLSDGSVLIGGMKKNGFWVRENKKYIPIYDHLDYGNDTLIRGFIVRPLRLRDFIETADEERLLKEAVL